MNLRWTKRVTFVTCAALALFVLGDGQIVADAPLTSPIRLAQTSDSDSILASLEKLDKAILEQADVEERTRARLAEVRTQLGGMETRRATLAAAIAARRGLISKRVRALYKYSGRGFLSAVLGDSGELSTLARTRYLLFIVRKDMSLLEAQKADLGQFGTLESSLIAQQSELETVVRQAEIERLRLEEERLRRVALLDRIRKEQSLKDRAQQELAVADERLAARMGSLGARPARQGGASSARSQPDAAQPQPDAAQPQPVVREAAGPLPGAATPQPANTEPIPPAAVASRTTPIPPAAVASRATPIPPAAAAASAKPATAGQAAPAVQTPPPEAVASVVPTAPVGAFERAKGKHVFPTTGRVTRAFGRYRVEGMLAPAFSKGIEVVAPAGTPFKAVADGQVQMADWFKGYGLMVIINHGNDYRSIYTHASRLVVKVGQQVQAGDVIGLVGETGSLKGPYLYLEIRKGTTPINPLEWLAVPPGIMDLE